MSNRASTDGDVSRDLPVSRATGRSDDGLHRSPIPVVLVVDVEPDGFFIDTSRRDPWKGFSQTVELLESVRLRLTGHDEHGPRFTWTVRMDPQVAEVYGRADWAAKEYPHIFETVRKHGDELGVHPHAYRREGASWTLDYGDPSWTEFCLRESLDAFASAFGRPCRIARVGDRWISQAFVRLLEESGIAYDLTLEPGLPGGPFDHHGGRITGCLPDLRDVPRAPFHPAAHDFRQPAVPPESGLLMVPLSTAPVRPAAWRRLAYRVLKRGAHSPMSTLLLSHEPGLFQRIVDIVLRRPGPRHLVMAMRSNAALDSRLRRRILKNVETLHRHPFAERFAWVPPPTVAELLETSVVR